MILALIPGVSGVSYIQANGKSIAKINDSGIYYYHPDHLGSTSVMTDSDGGVVEEQVNLPFGQPISGSERYGFTGKEQDETGLQYFGARYYSPLTGKFLTVDSAKDGVNWYGYAGNNPLIYVDLDGREVHPLYKDRKEIREAAHRDVSGILALPCWSYNPLSKSDIKKLEKDLKNYETKFLKYKSLFENYRDKPEKMPFDSDLDDERKASIIGGIEEAEEIVKGPGTEMEKVERIFSRISDVMVHCPSFPKNDPVALAAIFSTYEFDVGLSFHSVHQVGLSFHGPPPVMQRERRHIIALIKADDEELQFDPNKRFYPGKFIPLKRRSTTFYFQRIEKHGYFQLRRNPPPKKI